MAKLLVFFLLVAFNVTFAEPNQQSGDLELEDVGNKAKSSFSVNQDRAISWLEQLKSGSYSELDSGAVLHLAASYLYCTIKTGPCAHILDTILAADLIRTKAANISECPTLREFWKVYLENQFDKRANYLVPVGLVGKVSEFNSKIRPGYIRCSEKLKQASSDKVDLTPQILASLQLLKTLREKEINVFAATGAITDKKKTKEK